MARRAREDKGIQVPKLQHITPSLEGWLIESIPRTYEELYHVSECNLEVRASLAQERPSARRLGQHAIITAYVDKDVARATALERAKSSGKDYVVETLHTLGDYGVVTVNDPYDPGIAISMASRRKRIVESFPSIEGVHHERHYEESASLFKEKGYADALIPGHVVEEVKNECSYILREVYMGVVKTASILNAKRAISVNPRAAVLHYNATRYRDRQCFEIANEQGERCSVNRDYIREWTLANGIIGNRIDRPNEETGGERARLVMLRELGALSLAEAAHVPSRGRKHLNTSATSHKGSASVFLSVLSRYCSSQARP